MKHILINLALLFLSFSLVACSSTNTRSQNTSIGAVTGAVIGGVAGSAIGAGTGQIVAIGVGAVAGALIGGAIGNSMDSSDSAKVYSAMDHNPAHKASTWKNPKTGARYSVAPTSNMMTIKGNPNCRQFRSVVWVNGKKQHIKGVACRQADGTWQAVGAG